MFGFYKGSGFYEQCSDCQPDKKDSDRIESEGRLDVSVTFTVMNIQVS
jgi:hypothetical protein